MSYHFERRARSPRNVAFLTTVWVGLAAVWIGLDAAWWVVVALAMFTLPAVWDIARDARSSVTVSTGCITWQGAFSEGQRKDVDHVRMNRRFDGSMKILLVHVGGATTRLPPDISPPPDAFEAALVAANIPVQRHPFSPF